MTVLCFRVASSVNFLVCVCFMHECPLCVWMCVSALSWILCPCFYVLHLLSNTAEREEIERTLKHLREKSALDDPVVPNLCGIQWKYLGCRVGLDPTDFHFMDIIGLKIHNIEYLFIHSLIDLLCLVLIYSKMLFIAMMAKLNFQQPLLVFSLTWFFRNQSNMLFMFFFFIN